MGFVNGAVTGFIASSAQLLTNGKVLFMTYSAASYLLEPDAYGSYLNSTLRRIGDMPYTHLYGAVSVLNDGRICCHPGEFGTSYPAYMSIFDPKTETWSSTEAYVWTDVAQTMAHGFGNHSLVFVTDDGRVMDVYGTLPAKKKPPYTALTPSAHGGNAFSFSVSERGATLLPDGSFVVFSRQQELNQKVLFISPGYSSEMIAEGSTNVVAGQSSYDIIMSNRVGPWWRMPTNNADRSTWGSVDYGVIYEIGPAMYMPKIGKVAFVGGNGQIYTQSITDRTISGFNYAATLPNETQYPDQTSQTYYLGVVSSSYNGQTPASVVATGTFTFTSTFVDKPNKLAVVQQKPNKQVWVRLSNNTRWVCINYTSAASGSGYDIVLSGCSFGAFPGSNWGTQTFATDDQVCNGRPSYEVHDGPGAILPNGDLIFIGGLSVDSSDGFNKASSVLKWDGSSAMAEIMVGGYPDQSFSSIPEYACLMFPLPDGNVFIKGANGIRYYIPTTEEATPITGSRPTITSAPITAIAGRKFNLIGTQLTGLHEGGSYGDDNTPRTNFPIVKLTNNLTSKVYYCRTRDFTYRGIQAGRTSSCNVHVPENVDPGAYVMTVVTNGISSTGVNITIHSVISGQVVGLN